MKQIRHFKKSAARLCLAMATAATPAFGDGEALSAEAAGLVDGNNQFAMELYAQLAAASTGNVFISPWSVSTAFAMAWAGARGETAGQMAEVLRFPADQATTHPLFGELITALNRIQEDGKLVLNTANALWPAAGHSLLPDYTATLDTHYGAYAEALDYRAETEASRQRINGWVADQTAGRIPDLIAEGMLVEDTAIVLTNAIYFKGAWKTLFNPDNTQPGRFTVLDGTEIEIDLMFMKEDLLFFEGDGLTLVTLPYHEDKMEAVLLSPDDGDIRALEARLSTEALAGWLQQRTEQRGIVHLPRFGLRYKEELSNTLKTMGMELPFRPGGADFSGIFGDPGLFISMVIHETFLQVKEEGTEAAGATGIGIELTSIQPMPTFHGDRPFLFLIRDTDTGSLLFMGRVAEPSPLEEDPTPPDPETVRACFGSQAALIDGWWQDTGIGRFQAEAWPWIRHESLGWLYLDAPTGSPAKGCWLYDFSLGWLHTSSSSFPTLWSPESGWLRYLPGSQSPRWFYRHADGHWVTY